MGFVTNRWQPVNASPGPTPPPTWEQLKNNVTATTSFNYSGYNYTEYVILVYKKNTTIYYQMFYIPDFGSTTNIQYCGYTDIIIYLSSTSSALTFSVRQRTSTVTSDWRYTVYGRRKTSWSLVTDQSALPDYTEFISNHGFYTPFKFQNGTNRTSGGTNYSSSTTLKFPANSESIWSNKYSYYLTQIPSVYTRLNSNENSWTQITSTSSSVSIADISYSEMFIVGKRLMLPSSSGGGTAQTMQTLYVFPEMLMGTFQVGGYTRYRNSTYTGSYGSITISATSVGASYTQISDGRPSSTFQSIDIYYR